MIIYSVSYLTLCTSSPSPLPQVRRSHFGGGEHPGGPCRDPPPTAHPAGSLQGRGPADGRQLRRAGGALLPHQPHAALRRQPGVALYDCDEGGELRVQALLNEEPLTFPGMEAAPLYRVLRQHYLPLLKSCVFEEVCRLPPQRK